MGSHYSTVTVCNYSPLILNIQIGLIFENKVFPNTCEISETLKRETHILEARLWNGANYYRKPTESSGPQNTMFEYVMTSLNFVVQLIGSGFTAYGALHPKNVTDSPHYSNGMAIFVINDRFNRTRLYDRWVTDFMYRSSVTVDRDKRFSFTNGPAADFQLIDGNLVQIINPDNTYSNLTVSVTVLESNICENFTKNDVIDGGLNDFDREVVTSDVFEFISLDFTERVNIVIHVERSGREAVGISAVIKVVVFGIVAIDFLVFL